METKKKKLDKKTRKAIVLSIFGIPLAYIGSVIVCLPIVGIMYLFKADEGIIENVSGFIVISMMLITAIYIILLV